MLFLRMVVCRGQKERGRICITYESDLFASGEEKRGIEKSIPLFFYLSKKGASAAYDKECCLYRLSFGLYQALTKDVM